MNGSQKKQLHPAWMLGAGTALWLLEIAALLYWNLIGNNPLFIPQWKILVFIVFIHLLTAMWFGLMWKKVLRWRRRKSQRVSPEVRAEKERIAQDLHDGVVCHLLNALALLEMEKPEVEKIQIVVGHAMLALRNEMQTLDDVDATLIERLSSLRWQIQPLLHARGMDIQWEIPIREEDNSARSFVGRQLALLAQEAISNAIQHSGGKNIRVKLQEKHKEEWFLEICDDGCGIAKINPIADDFLKREKGWGLTGMQSRAQLIGAQFNCATSDQGTIIRVVWKNCKQY